MALHVDGELRIVAVSSPEQAYALDGAQGIGHKVVRPPEREGAQAQVISHGQVAAQLIELPAARLVLNRATILLEAGVAFLARLLRLAMAVEARDGRPGALRRGLAGHGVQLAHKGMLLGKNPAIPVEIVARGAPGVLPQTHALIPDELRGADGLVQGLVLTGRALELA